MSMNFCSDCGDVLPSQNSADVKEVKCENQECGKLAKNMSSVVVTTRSKPADFPSSLRAKRSQVQQVSEDDFDVEASIRETCPNCGRDDQVKYSQRQTRSADEGSTIFYTCYAKGCGQKWTQNN